MGIYYADRLRDEAPMAIEIVVVLRIAVALRFKICWLTHYFQGVLAL
jgi:hypothetical protein